ncbi:hypothetical protein SISSUDRAFT_985460 [Sistotremastrum suecicum HHB10207 ss-3]|uniref:Adhesin domain-containing protein n=1 Tax=Sistotremastrum suecicum HHB10207 ss-3 TaxID=1314776 RepID=A0A166E069_9AGAM|nr:hypothetical protein SISSUDRAFT_985460 [Sistotremastrum suecicum HHB10207 ss-3]
MNTQAKLSCDLVFKALGIAIALYLGYGLFRLVQWARTPSPTGLEDMPEYSASLGCLNVPYIYGGDSENIYSFPVSNPDGSSSSVSINLSGGAVGTLLVAQGDEDDVQIEMDLRTNEEPLLDKVVLLVENTEDISRKQFKLSTPASATSEDACMRYDIIVRVPSDLKELEITSKAISHVKFDERSSLSLESLSINLQSAFPSNLLLPTSEIHAISTSLEMRGGYLVGSAAILNQTMIKTSRGSAISNIHFFSEPYGFPSTPATLKTDTGSGRSDFWYANPEKRPIRSEHIASSAGDLYLTYREARYEGKLDVKSKSMSSTGIEGMMGARPGAGGGTGEKTDPWVGDEQGGDKLKVRSQGWVGLYF